MIEHSGKTTSSTPRRRRLFDEGADLRRDSPRLSPAAASNWTAAARSASTNRISADRDRRLRVRTTSVRLSRVVSDLDRRGTSPLRDARRNRDVHLVQAAETGRQAREQRPSPGCRRWRRRSAASTCRQRTGRRRRARRHSRVTAPRPVRNMATVSPTLAGFAGVTIAAVRRMHDRAAERSARRDREQAGRAGAAVHVHLVRLRAVD